MNELRLLSLDFDGTMVGPWLEGKAAVSEELVKCLAALRKRGALLAINTGRSLALVDQGMELFPAIPDFALTTEREIFCWTKEGWEPFSDWNQQCHRDHEELFTEAALLLAEIEAYILNERLARSYREYGRLVGLIAQNDGEMDRIVEYLRLQCGRVAITPSIIKGRCSKRCRRVLASNLRKHLLPGTTLMTSRCSTPGSPSI